MVRLFGVEIAFECSMTMFSNFLVNELKNPISRDQTLQSTWKIHQQVAKNKWKRIIKVDWRVGWLLQVEIAFRCPKRPPFLLFLGSQHKHSNSEATNRATNLKNISTYTLEHARSEYYGWLVSRSTCGSRICHLVSTMVWQTACRQHYLCTSTRWVKTKHPKADLTDKHLHRQNTWVPLWS